MKSISHWTPRYILNKVNEMIYIRRHPDHPWLTKTANVILETMLKKDDVGLEFGAGRSTLWFSRRISSLTSIEHDVLWFNEVNNMIKKKDIKNVNLIYAPEEVSLTDRKYSKYVRTAELFDNDSLDFVLVDGMYRSECANAVLDKIRPGGILVIDDINWYLPSESYSPASRKIKEGPVDENWAEFFNAIDTWRHIWTTSGITDTALFIKPCGLLR